MIYCRFILEKWHYILSGLTKLWQWKFFQRVVSERTIRFRTITEIFGRSSLNFFKVGNMVEIDLCQSVSIDQKYSTTFNLIAMCSQSIFSSQIYIPVDLICILLLAITLSKNTFCVQSAAGQGPNSDFKPGFGFIFSLVMLTLLNI